MKKGKNVLIYDVAVLVQIYINSIGGPDLGPGNALTGKQRGPTDLEATGANGRFGPRIWDPGVHLPILRSNIEDPTM